jgi:hypothetical protein
MGRHLETFPHVHGGPRDERMRDPALPPPRTSLAADERRDGLHLVRAAAPQAVQRVRAAGEEECVFAIATVNLTFDILTSGCADR